MSFFYSFEEALRYSEKQSFFLSYRNVFFPVFIDYKKSKKWVVFTPGACARDRPMPVFQRSSYTKNLDCNVISLFDPGLLVNKNITNAWFCGTPARYHGDYIATLIKKFFSDRKVRNKDVLLFGTSAGGLPSLKIAQKLPGSTVWAGNIQTIAHQHSAFPKMLPVLYPNLTHDDCVESFSHRFDAREMDGKYTLLYFQNKSDVFHYRNHYKPYRQWWEAYEAREAEAVFYEYEDPVTGHGPVGRNRELQLIDRMLSGKNIDVKWAKRV